MRRRLLTHQLVTDGHERLGRPRRARDQPTAEKESDDGDHDAGSPRPWPPSLPQRPASLQRRSRPCDGRALSSSIAPEPRHGPSHPPAESEPRPEDVRFLEDQLYLYNVEKTGFDDGRWLAFFVREADGAIAAGSMA